MAFGFVQLGLFDQTVHQYFSPPQSAQRYHMFIVFGLCTLMIDIVKGIPGVVISIYVVSV